MNKSNNEKQVLYLVFGGELEEISKKVIRNPDDIDLVGIFSSRDKAYDAWKAKSQQMVDNALMRYFIIDIPLSFQD
ncbi:DUF4170 domain-containing protein [Candidatus Liberibacter americanus]|uniref:Inositol monophosphatase n=1 Tax=Candidatus Liberibacter americanus str. Sao Paulo TaxID=1261131 RepID=U6B3L5_9HYPH|nr:DUF4170 domain-containing protein [Candidatus Liberibacter americanus]AHA27664.1 hypothetical protein lam_293 [Candidatus Liberibacter americanus str. Sao Paulo]EMS36373.1 hypothetical protein G653_01818 [Candidatus Liberibacter americanus PW_SP]